MEQTQKVKLEKLLHYNMTCIGGFMGTCAICGFEGNFTSAQTGNIMSLTKELVGGDLFQVSLRLGGVDSVLPFHGSIISDKAFFKTRYGTSFSDGRWGMSPFVTDSA